ncbi:MAG TPA: glycosyltransferase family 2 protein [Gemmataceae bacterium]
MSRDGVTIAIPNWNHELLLARSILSGLQTLKALNEEGCPGEVLVIDDNSRDGSLTLLRQLEALYCQEGLCVLALNENIGLAAVRNQALVHSRYRYVAFFDADDELIPENIPCLWRAICETGAAAAYGNILRRLLSSAEVFEVYSNESFQDQMFDSNYISCFGLFDREQLLDTGGYFRAFPTLEDYEEWLHLACNGRRIVFVPIAHGYYDMLPNSMITDNTQGQQTHQKILRIFDQVKARKYLSVNTRHLRYHPAVGYL